MGLGGYSCHRIATETQRFVDMNSLVASISDDDIPEYWSPAKDRYLQNSLQLGCQG
jgi:hypothetical protein